MRRVKVIGDCATAKALRTLVARDATLVHGQMLFDVQVEIATGPVDCPVVDGVDSEFERLVVKHIGALTPSGQVLVLFSAGRIARDNQIAITVPDTERESIAVEHGVYRALLEAARPVHPAAPRRWWQR